MPPNTETTIDTVDRWLKFTGNYGMSFVFTACILLLFLWVTYTTVSLLKKWIPVWFAWNIRSHQKTCEYLESSTETLACIHDRAHSHGEAISHLSAAAKKMVEKNGSVIKGGSDVIFHLDNALNALGEAERGRIRREEERRRRLAFEKWQAEQKEKKSGKPRKPSDSSELYPDEYTDKRRKGDPGPESPTTETE